MPTYEYACTSCGHEFELEQSIKDDPINECPKCKNATAKRQISRGTGFILKGGGWYSDLYSSSGNKPASGGSDKAVLPPMPASGSITNPSAGAASSGGSSSGGSSGGSSSGGSSSGGSSGST